MAIFSPLRNNTMYSTKSHHKPFFFSFSPPEFSHQIILIFSLLAYVYLGTAAIPSLANRRHLQTWGASHLTHTWLKRSGMFYNTKKTTTKENGSYGYILFSIFIFSTAASARLEIRICCRDPVRKAKTKHLKIFFKTTETLSDIFIGSSLHLKGPLHWI